MTRTVFKAALLASLPVMMGYLTMGFAAGVLLSGGARVGAAPFWALLSSAVNISGALQFIMVGWMRDSVPLLEVALLTLCLNLRYAMYGLSLIGKFRGISPLKKFYLIWSLTDETYALETAERRFKGESAVSYCLAVAALDHFYWVAGVVSGAVAGASLPFSNRGIDFAMTALFLVIMTDQCRERENRLPTLIGLGAALVSRLFFSVANMLIPAMVLMLVAFMLWRGRLDCAAAVPEGEPKP